MARSLVKAVLAAGLVCAAAFAQAEDGYRGMSIERLEHLAVLDDTDAMNELSLRYMTGRGALENYQLAFDWAYQAAVNGSMRGALNYATILALEVGRAIKQDLEDHAITTAKLAYIWLNIAGICYAHVVEMRNIIRDFLVETEKFDSELQKESLMIFDATMNGVAKCEPLPAPPEE